jgi:transcriptional regulator with XRE-family HTH domain
MKTSKNLSKWIEDSKKNDSYWFEAAKLDFAMSLEKQRKSAEMSYSDLAKKLETSAAYISKVFRGDSNLTIESMVKLARTTGGELRIEITHQPELATEAVVESHAPTVWANVIRLPVEKNRRSATEAVSSWTFVDCNASNGNHQSNDQIAA